MLESFLHTVIYTILPAVVVFGMMIIFHELGHFLVAKLMGVQVFEFSIGFGPRIYRFVKGETFYTLRALPLGGFVRMAGMDAEEDNREMEKRKELCAEKGVDFDFCVDPERSFTNKGALQRIAVIAAGPLMNFVLAVFLYAIMYAYIGLPVNVIKEVSPGKPAAAAGIKPGDKVVAVNNKPVRTWEGLVDVIHNSANKKVTLTVERDNRRQSFTVVPELDKTNKIGLIGIAPVIERPGILKSISLGTVHTYRVLVLTFDFLGKMFAKQVPVELSGPVRITMELGKAAEMGIMPLIQLAGFLSIQIGLFNLFPIPALDGSRIIFLGIEGLRGRPVDPSKENFIHLVGLSLLLLLMVVITYKDILHIIG
ncbi:RIP metalloprotease RseP [Thermincola potens]|uniref:Zinc metalloprotease n=1 Tax=Thermincola potens (strain JR) TaxID=635013 RepID=D5XF02_THEPJ|nr:RIP metalloprotease RseP [Thermincola potens]ADG82223.1 membrane-associated zinc metalloprotease [Thermincola potens JR]